MATDPPKNKLWYLGMLVAFFLVNDLPLMQAGSYGLWILLDYLVRFLVVLAAIYIVTDKGGTVADFGLTRLPVNDAVKWSLLLSVTGILIDQVVWKIVEYHLPPTKMMSFPVPTSPWLNYIDLTFGLALVSLSEELVFRGYFYSVTRNLFNSQTAVVGLSAIIFGISHWSLGVHAIITTTIWGILPMMAMAKTGSIIPALVAHYLTNLVGFSGVIPDYLFNFLKH